jgi:hypothetical protein
LDNIPVLTSEYIHRTLIVFSSPASNIVSALFGLNPVRAFFYATEQEDGIFNKIEGLLGCLFGEIR